MSLDLVEKANGKVVIVRVSGKLKQEDYQKFSPEVKRLIEQHDTIRVLFDMRGFEGWGMGGLWEDIKFNISYFSSIERLAMVGESRWQEWMTTFCQPFTRAKIAYFERDEYEQAELWLEAD